MAGEEDHAEPPTVGEALRREMDRARLEGR